MKHRHFCRGGFLLSCLFTYGLYVSHVVAFAGNTAEKLRITRFSDSILVPKIPEQQRLLPNFLDSSLVQSASIAQVFTRLEEKKLVEFFNRVKSLEIENAYQENSKSFHFRSRSIPILEACACSGAPIALRILTILYQIEDILKESPSLDEPWVHTSFGEGGFLQTYWFATALSTFGFRNIHLNIIAPEVTEPLPYLQIFSSIPAVRSAQVFTSVTAYREAMSHGDARRSQSFDTIDVGEMNRIWIPAHQKGKGNYFLITGTAPEDPANLRPDEMQLFEIAVSNTSWRDLSCKGKKDVLKRSFEIDSDEECSNRRAAEFVDRFCTQARNSIQNATSRDQAIAAIYTLASQYSSSFSSSKVKNWRYFTRMKRARDHEYFDFTVTEYKNAGLDFKELLEETREPGSHPIIYELIQSSIRKHKAQRMLSL